MSKKLLVSYGSSLVGATLILLFSCTGCGEPDASIEDASTDAGNETDTSEDGGPDGGGEPAGWVTIPAGGFWMGSPGGDCPEDYPGGSDCAVELFKHNREDLHYVQITRDFELMSAEVTQGQFGSVMGWNPSFFGPNSAGQGLDCGSDCPVEWLSWYDALAYANELSEQSGMPPCYIFSDVLCGTEWEDLKSVGSSYMECMNEATVGIWSAMVELNGVETVYECTGYRLPTESEWEYAARAGSLSAIYPSQGNDGTITDEGRCNPPDPNLTQIAVYCGNRNLVEPVRSMEPNAWFLYDMLGNVWEWVWDSYADYPKGNTSSPVVDPLSLEDDDYRVLRGCSWNSGVDECRSAFRREASSPARRFYYGVRLARSK